MNAQTILCLASYHKGDEFLRECKRQGWRTLLLTSESLRGADWPHESLDEIYYIPDDHHEWNMPDVILAVSHLARSVQIDTIVALDDFDVEKAAELREHLRLPGMSQSVARYFRDKLAMRTKAAEANIAVPRFVGIFNYDRIREFFDAVSPPYVLKPRSQASAIGILFLDSAESVWRSLDELGDKQSFYVLEEFIKGGVYHVDSIVYDNRVVFAIASQYGTPPMEVSHEGRVFTTRTLPNSSKDAKALLKANQALLKAFGLGRGVSHTEFIKSEDGSFYFLETSARVGGANIADMVEGATGVNLWREWAKVETESTPETYQVPSPRSDSAALIVSLSKQETPDLSGYDAPEIYWRMQHRHHAGLVIQSADQARIEALLQEYTQRFYTDFFTSLPAPPSANY